jgi:hypothetical protein
MNNDQIMRQWESFAAAVMPPDPAVDQVRTMRWAFFAGAMAALSLMQEIGGDDITEMAGVEMLEGAHEECKEFARGLAAGHFGRHGVPSPAVGHHAASDWSSWSPSSSLTVTPGSDHKRTFPSGMRP